MPLVASMLPTGVNACPRWHHGAMLPWKKMSGSPGDPSGQHTEGNSNPGARPGTATAPQPPCPQLSLVGGAPRDRRSFRATGWEAGRPVFPKPSWKISRLVEISPLGGHLDLGNPWWPGFHSASLGLPRTPVPFLFSQRGSPASVLNFRRSQGLG